MPPGGSGCGFSATKSIANEPDRGDAELLAHDAASELIRPVRERSTEATPGMTREQAVTTDTMWAGFVRTDAGMVSGWHHHGEYETSIYVISGALRMEYGPGGAEVLEAAPGDFVYVPPRAIHREGNPSDEESTLVVVRAGTGDPVTDVEGPAPQ
jgi:uncharacterized RmlC-like cupin family protein